MPQYEYKCKKCGHKFEDIIGMNDPNPECPECEGEVEKLISSSNFKLNGRGWGNDGYQGSGSGNTK